MPEAPKILNKSWKLPSTEVAVQETGRQILDQVKAFGFEEDCIFAIHLALEEALVNAVKHGNKSDPEKKVKIECLMTPDKFDVSITDEGEGFDPDEIPDPRCEKNLYRSSGRGVLLIRAYMDKVEFNTRGNKIHMIKYRPKDQSSKSPKSSDRVR